MFLGADRFVFQNAEKNRHNPTNAELILWERYLRHKPLGYKFRRQHPLSIFIADFYCHPLKLVIELDGSIHFREDVKAWDKERQNLLEAEGLHFLRFVNHEVEHDLNSVTLAIENFIRKYQEKNTQRHA